MRLKSLVGECGEPSAVVVGEAANAAQALVWLATRSCDLLLLDVQMPGRDGTQLAAELRLRTPAPAIVFVTAHAEHALKAFDLEAVDYLTKPVKRERLQAALRRVAQRLGAPPTVGHARPSPRRRARSSSSATAAAIIRVPVADVLYMKAELKYVTLRTAEHTHVLDDSLAELESRLGDRFLRVHRNALVARARRARARAARDRRRERRRRPRRLGRLHRAGQRVARGVAAAGRGGARGAGRCRALARCRSRRATRRLRCAATSAFGASRRRLSAGAPHSRRTPRHRSVDRAGDRRARPARGLVCAIVRRRGRGRPAELAPARRRAVAMPCRARVCGDRGRRASRLARRQRRRRSRSAASAGVPAATRAGSPLAVDEPSGVDASQCRDPDSLAQRARRASSRCQRDLPRPHARPRATRRRRARTGVRVRAARLRGVRGRSTAGVDAASSSSRSRPSAATRSARLCAGAYRSCTRGAAAGQPARC